MYVRMCKDQTGAIDLHCDYHSRQKGYQSKGYNGHSLKKGATLWGSARGLLCSGQWSIGPRCWVGRTGMQFATPQGASTKVIGNLLGFVTGRVVHLSFEMVQCIVVLWLTSI